MNISISRNIRISVGLVSKQEEKNEHECIQTSLIRVFHYFNVRVCRLSFYGQVLQKLNRATKIMYQYVTVSRKNVQLKRFNPGMKETS